MQIESLSFKSAASSFRSLNDDDAESMKSAYSTTGSPVYKFIIILFSVDKKGTFDIAVYVQYHDSRTVCMTEMSSNTVHFMNEFLKCVDLLEINVWKVGLYETIILYCNLKLI